MMSGSAAKPMSMKVLGSLMRSKSLRATAALGASGHAHVSGNRSGAGGRLGLALSLATRPAQHLVHINRRGKRQDGRGFAFSQPRTLWIRAPADREHQCVRAARVIPGARAASRVGDSAGGRHIAQSHSHGNRRLASGRGPRAFMSERGYMRKYQIIQEEDASITINIVLEAGVPSIVPRQYR